MTSRLLPRDEWERLSATELESVAPYLRANPNAEVFVVEDAGGDIVGCWALMQIWHAEGLWIAPELRRHGAVARLLLKHLYALAAHFEIPGVMTAATTPEVAALLEDHRLGATRLNGQHYLLPLMSRSQKESEPCLPQ
jgi:hypothetical protein